MKNVFTAAITTLFVAVFLHPGGASLAAVSAAHSTAGTVKVTVTYNGKGKVDASHKLWVWLFDTPNIGPGAMPIAQVALDKNGTDAVFDDVAGDKVYVAAAFDEQGSMAGDGPPPTGSPVGVLLGSDGVPSPVTPGGKAPAVVNFDDSIRMP